MGLHHYFVPAGEHSRLGCLGYVRAAVKIHEQMHSLGIGDAWLVMYAILDEILDKRPRHAYNRLC
jgi:hypothetical protein